MALMEALGNGLLFGLLLALLVGPVFFALIQTSIEKDFAAGASMAVGIALSDALYVIIASAGVAALAENKEFQVWLGLIGGTIMFLFGLVNLLKKVAARQENSSTMERGGLARQFVKGFVLNGINPFVLLFWIGIASMVNLNYNYSFPQELAFFAAIVVTVFLLDLVKSFVAHKLRTILSVRLMVWMNRVVGIVLILFSFRLFYFALETLGLLPDWLPVLG
jgi:threonine/homoserine/homoserine lactone efflux protein